MSRKLAAILVLALGLSCRPAPIPIQSQPKVPVRSPPFASLPPDEALLRSAGMGLVDGIEAALERGARVDAADARGHTALMKAAERGHKEAIRLLLLRKADVRRLAADGRTTALGLAVGDFDTARLLLEGGAPADTQGTRGNTALIGAADSGRIDRVAFLLQRGASVDVKNDDGNTALYFAATSGQVEAVKLLLQKGADPDSVNKNAQTPISGAFYHGIGNTPPIEQRARAVLAALLAVSHGPPKVAPSPPAREPSTAERYLFVYARFGMVAELARLFEQGVRIAAVDLNGNSALHHACAEGQLAAARWLLEHGAEVNEAGAKQATPLMHAARIGRVELVELLLGRGARIDARDQEGATALGWASGGADEPKVLAVLLAAGAALNAPDPSGRTPLLLAISARRERNTAALIEAGADLKARARDGRDALISAIAMKLPALARKLIEKGAPVDGFSSFSESPLISAIGEKDHALMRLLLDKGAPIDAADPTHHMTPLMHAALVGDPAMVQTLLDRGADPRLRALPYGTTAAGFAEQRGHGSLAALLREREQRPPTK
jgi:ankyrin repeat protein